MKDIAKWRDHEFVKIALSHLSGYYRMADDWTGSEYFKKYKSYRLKAMKRSLMLKAQGIVEHDRILTNRPISGKKQ